MAYPYANNAYYAQQPMFPQPNGNVYIIQNSLEVANIPAGAGITAALCLQENLLYLKSVQNGMPVFIAYKLSSYNEGPKVGSTATQQSAAPSLEDRMANLEKQVNLIVNSLGGKKNEPVSNADGASTTTTTWDT